MSPNPKSKLRFAAALSGMLLSLAINSLVPALLYIVLRSLRANDIAALAVAGAIPAVRTLALALWRRQVDWIGVYAVLGFAISLAVYIFLGKNALLLKIQGSLLTGTIGAVLLISVAVGKPLLLSLIQAAGQGGAAGTNGLDEVAADAASQKRVADRLSFITLMIGLMACGDMVAHIVLALALPTSSYVGLSPLATAVIVGSGVAVLWWTRRPNAAQAAN